MKSFLRIACIAVAGILLLSCTRAGKLYENSAWYGEYPAGREEDRPSPSETGAQSFIQLTFRTNGETCEVCYGDVGSDGSLFFGCLVSVFDVEWSQRTFKLIFKQDGQPRVCYSGKISGKKMSLDVLEQDKVEYTFELQKIN